MANFAYDIKDASSASNEAMKLRKNSQTLVDYCDSIKYVCDQISAAWEGEDGIWFVEKLKMRSDAIKSFANDGFYPLAEAIEEYCEAMLEITSQKAK